MRGSGDFSGRPASAKKDWTKGSIIGNLLGLSWPMMISSSLMMLGPTIDLLWVGRLGTTAIAAVGVTGMAVMVINPLLAGLFTGVRAMVARFIGGGDYKSANHVAQQAFVIAAAFSSILAIIGICLTRQILILLGLETDVIAEGTTYMRIQFVGMVFMALERIGESIMQASGDAVTPMRISIGARIFHVVLCPFLIFGWSIFPRLGVSGAALTNVIAQGLGGSILFWALFTGRTRLHLTFKDFHLDLNMIWRMVKIGIPASVNGMGRSLNQLILVRFVAAFGTLAVAAHSLCQRIDMLIVMPAMGLGQASGVLAGQNLGAVQPKRAERTGWLAAFVVSGLMVIGAMAIWFYAENIVSIFNPEPDLVIITTTFMRIAIVGILMMGFNVVLMHCLLGVGDTLPPMLVTIITFWLVQLPLAYYLPKITDLGVYGVRWAMVAGMFIQAVAFTTYFRAGKWKGKKV